MLAHGELLVIETDDDAYLGTVEVARGGQLIVRSGYVGRPVVLAADDVVALTTADAHPDV